MNPEESETIQEMLKESETPRKFKRIRKITAKFENPDEFDIILRIKRDSERTRKNQKEFYTTRENPRGVLRNTEESSRIPNNTKKSNSEEFERIRENF